MVDIRVLDLTADIGALENVAQQIISEGRDLKIWTFSGDLGTGKTTLISEICRQLGVIDTVKSPSYNLIHEYLTLSNEQVFHFDFYRLNEVDEALDLGIEEYFYSQNLCLIEWPELIKDYIPIPNMEIQIKLSGEDCRLYRIKKNE